jgi:hypothetical protein
VYGAKTFVDHTTTVENLGGADDLFECADGFAFSAVCGATLYCSPQQEAAPAYSAVEVATRSLDPLLADYREPQAPDDAAAGRWVVHGWVPARVVHRLIFAHGGPRDSSQYERLPPLAPCEACQQPLHRCVAATCDDPSVESLHLGAPCRTCHQPFDARAPWIPPPTPWRPAPTEDHAVLDAYGYPLTYETVVLAHARAAQAVAVEGYDSEGDEWHGHPVAVDQLSDARIVCGSWPGPVCPACWAASCAGCGYVFEAPWDAGAVGRFGRLLCSTCAPAGASFFDPVCSSDEALMSVDMGSPPRWAVGDRIRFLGTGGAIWAGSVLGVCARSGVGADAGLETVYKVQREGGGAEEVLAVPACCLV